MCPNVPEKSRIMTNPIMSTSATSVFIANLISFQPTKIMINVIMDRIQMGIPDKNSIILLFHRMRIIDS